MNYYNLTTPQKNIWNLQKYYGDTAIGNQCGAIFYNEKRDSDLLRMAVHIFIKYQSGMRLRFVEKEDVLQYISNEVEDIPIMTFATMDEFDYFTEGFAKKSIGLNDVAMYRFVIVQVENKSGILVVLSHLISDAWTFGLMANQVDEAYHTLAEKTDYDNIWRADYTEYVQKEKEYFVSEKYKKDKFYWENKYISQPEKSIIKMISAKAEGIEAKRYTKCLSVELEDKINKFCSNHQVTPAVLFEMAVIIYLAKINAENTTITIGIPVLNRSNAKEKKIAGMFVSTMPLTGGVKADMEILELAHQIRKGHMEIFRHQKYPYSDILKYLREKQNFSGNLYDVMISYQNAKTDTNAETKWYSNGYSEVPFTMHIDNRDEKSTHTINVDYQTAAFKDDREIKYVISRIEHILTQIVDETSKNLKEIGTVPQTEMKKIIEEFNDTYVEYPREKCVHELFTEQAKKMPDEIALVFEDEKFTYKQLDEMSNSLAHYLREKGVKRNEVVPIIARRSWHVIVAMLGIMKAGGAYMPVSPEFPLERIKYMFEIAEVRVALTYGYSIAVDNTYFKDEKIEMISLGDIDYSVNILGLQNQNRPEDLCYIIFTSGSTGQPKGVSIEHSNVINYCHNNRYNICSKAVSRDKMKIVSVTNIVFDIFVTESLLPLLNGMIIYLADEDEVISQNKLSKLIMKNKIDVIQTTPTKMKSYMLDKNLDYLSILKVIVLGGEAFSEELYKEIVNYSKAKVVNIYGPAETTVWSTITTICNDDITIGSPIANTQIYILDKNNELFPIGVPGELCIAGEGVGKGYLYRPNLTAEKFVPNPFATAENRHGKIMYHTGDLACWRADGEIEYLGRIDTQVKIRGLRIELGEIENVMSGFDGIQLTAVVDKRDENNRQYLVGYYTSEKEIDEKKLRIHLSSKLPKYMVPNYFMRLEAMPMTASGKTDRKNLPVPDFTMIEREYVAPETEMKTNLCKLLGEILHIEKVGVEDDFFENGGDSLAALEYVAKAHGIGVEMSLQNVFDYPTVRSLCDFLQGEKKEKVQYKDSDFDKYKEIFDRNRVTENETFEKKSLGNVLLTGATGFLGAHVLDELMRKETGKIYCLVRSSKEDDRHGKLNEILRYYFGDRYESEINKRIIPVVGDIEKEGLTDVMLTDIQTVIHTAASVKHYGSYSYFYRVNTEGTAHIVEYAKKTGAKLIHISTLSVSGNSMADDFSVYRSEDEKFFYETSFYIGQPLDNVYIHSKFEAERVVYDAMLEGLDAKVIRVGNLTNRAIDYKFQPNYTSNAFLTRVKAILEFGLFPDYLMNLYAEFSPIDKTAEGIVKIAQYADKQCVFHLNSDKVIYFNRFLEIVRKLGIPMKVVSGEEFNKALQGTIKQRNTEHIFEAFQNDMDEQGRLVYDSNIHIENDFTLCFLKKVGFEWDKTDMEYINGYIDYFRKIGYLDKICK